MVTSGMQIQSQMLHCPQTPDYDMHGYNDLLQGLSCVAALVVISNLQYITYRLSKGHGQLFMYHWMPLMLVAKTIVYHYRVPQSVPMWFMQQMMVIRYGSASLLYIHEEAATIVKLFLRRGVEFSLLESNGNSVITYYFDAWSIL